MSLEKVLVLFTALLCMAAWTTPIALGQETNAADLITFVQDGPLSQQLHIPLYEWSPKKRQPDGMVLAIHGLTLHGKRYDVLGKAFAAEGFYVCATDMRGFGRCYTDEKHIFDVAGDCKQSVNYGKAYDDIVALAQAMKHAHPDLPLYAMGESLGTAVCIKLAAEHPELVSGLLLSGPTVKVHPLMMLHPHNMVAAFWALTHPRLQMSTEPFVRNLVSNDANIVEEMLSDPLCRKTLNIPELLQTAKFVKQTLSNASRLKPELPILVIQGSEDRCMVPHAVIRLSRNVRSAEQTVRWLHAHGHLLLETSYLRPKTVDSIDVWIREHSPAHAQDATRIRTEILQLGGKPVND